MKCNLMLVLGGILVSALACSGTASEEPSTGGGGGVAGGGTTALGDGSEGVIATPAAWKFAVEPNPLSDSVKKGLTWLVKHQNQNGGWGQGEESRHMGASLQRLAEKPNVGDTCISALALIRSGTSPSKGAYSKQLTRAIAFVCAQIEAAPEEGLYITDVKGTRLQMKLGTYIDTFLASMLLAEVRNRMGSEAFDKRVTAALDKVMDKIEKNQKADGTWANAGWATTLAQSMGVKGMNRAVQAGARVSDTALVNAANNAQESFRPEAQSFDAAGSAGVSLYAFSSNMGALRDSVNSSPMLERTLERESREAVKEEDRKKATDKLIRIREAKSTEKSAKIAVLKRLDDPKFIAGFGSNGGEEFLSYMNISESLVVANDDHWKKWDASMTQNISRIQNADGSWSGHHCITGRNFCTAAALLTLMADRTPVPAELVVNK